MTFDRFTFPNGLRVIGERLDNYRTVAIGLWVGVGSQNEIPGEEGLSHFIEHMVFKGTAKRTARQIAEEMDAVGGVLNAYTSKEATCFYAKVVDEDLRLAIDMIADMVTAPSFDAAELKKEKGVVIEEINMSEDTPEDLASELLMQAHYGDQPVSRPILGPAEQIRAYRSEDLRRYWAHAYKPQCSVLAIVGHYDWEQVLDMVQTYLADWSPEGLEERTCVTRPAKPRVLTKEKDIEQMHISLGYPGLCLGHDRNYELSVFNIAFGSSSSSRLFQKIREEHGLAYNVYCMPTAYLDTGLLTIYAATNPESADAVIDMILEEARRIVETGLSREEFAMARKQLEAGYIMGQESSTGRLQALGRRLLVKNTTQTEEEALETIRNIDFDGTNALLRDILTAPYSASLVGKGVDRIRIAREARGTA
ncbi:MAG: insulinase family protein [Clostridia bacterium]|nr:insulinase family protein [Clostridia bacterium]